MNIFVSTLAVVLPILILLLVGMFAKKTGLVNSETLYGADKLVYNICLPALIINNMYSAENFFSSNIYFYVFLAVALFAIYFLLLFIVPKVLPKEKQSAFCVSVLRSNNAVYGIPLATALLGEAQVHDVVAIQIWPMLLMNVLAAVCCEHFKEGGGGNAFKQILHVLKTPVVFSVIIGLLLKLLNVELPSFILSPLSMLSSATSPVAFVSLGTAITLKSSIKHKKIIGTSLLLKLVLIPLAAISFGVFVLGVRDVELIVLICVFATPTAATAPAMVRNYGGDYKLTGEAVTFSTLFSVLTVYAFVLALRLLGMLA